MKPLHTVSCHRVEDDVCAATYRVGTITDVIQSDLNQIEEQVFLINDGLIAKKADGLGLGLQAGDLVAYLETDDTVFIISLLSAAEPRARMTIEFGCADRLLITANHLDLVGRRSVSLRSFKDISLETGRTIKLTCENWLQNVVGSVVSVMGAWIQKCEQGSIETKGVMRSNAGSQIVTANEDLRLDAKRINMG